MKKTIKNKKNKSFKYLRDVLLGCAALTMSLLVYEAPKFKKTILRNYVSNKVVTITNYEGNSGGTGFFVQLPSGRTGILTNAHVCKMSESEPIFVQLDNDRKVPVKIIEISKETDLCLIESYGTTKGLAIGDSPEVGEQLYSVGHPALLPTSMTSGEISGPGEIDLLDHVIEEGKAENCSKPSQHKQEFDFIFFHVTACLERYQVFFSTIPSFPGNSGSPIIDKYGKVRGICFAGDTRINWAILLGADLIKKFLTPY